MQDKLWYGMLWYSHLLNHTNYSLSTFGWMFLIRFEVILHFHTHILITQLLHTHTWQRTICLALEVMFPNSSWISTSNLTVFPFSTVIGWSSGFTWRECGLPENKIIKIVVHVRNFQVFIWMWPNIMIRLLVSPGRRLIPTVSVSFFRPGRVTFRSYVCKIW